MTDIRTWPKEVGVSHTLLVPEWRSFSRSGRWTWSFSVFLYFYIFFMELELGLQWREPNRIALAHAPAPHSAPPQPDLDVMFRMISAFFPNPGLHFASDCPLSKKAAQILP